MPLLLQLPQTRWPVKGKDYGYCIYGYLVKQDGCSRLKLLMPFCELVCSSQILPFQVLILLATLSAVLQTFFIPYNPGWWFSYSFCFYIWILDCDILVIPVPCLSCAPWAWFATCLLYQLLSCSWERTTYGGSSQLFFFFFYIVKHSYRSSAFLCGGASWFCQYFFHLIIVYVEIWIGFESKEITNDFKIIENVLENMPQK